MPCPEQNYINLMYTRDLFLSLSLFEGPIYTMKAIESMDIQNSTLRPLLRPFQYVRLRDCTELAGTANQLFSLREKSCNAASDPCRGYTSTEVSCETKGRRVSTPRLWREPLRLLPYISSASAYKTGRYTLSTQLKCN